MRFKKAQKRYGVQVIFIFPFIKRKNEQNKCSQRCLIIAQKLVPKKINHNLLHVSLPETGAKTIFSI